MKEISLNTRFKNSPLYGKYVAQIDDEDFEIVSKYKWHIHKGGNNLYAVTNIQTTSGRQSIQMHRLIMGCTKGDGKIVDHIDGNPLNCQKLNLRFCTHSQNVKNRTPKPSNTSKYKGVFIIKQKRSFFVKKTNSIKTYLDCYWTATIHSDKKKGLAWTI